MNRLQQLSIRPISTKSAKKIKGGTEESKPKVSKTRPLTGFYS
ncbi:hypothetical protein [Ascidiimonas sp. W6]